MQFSYSYVDELEELILGTLMPVYNNYYLLKELKNPLQDIHPQLLSRIKNKPKLAALLRPLEKCS